jgi:hypothetical protein
VVPPASWFVVGLALPPVPVSAIEPPAPAAGVPLVPAIAALPPVPVGVALPDEPAVVPAAAAPPVPSAALADVCWEFFDAPLLHAASASRAAKPIDFIAAYARAVPE